MGNSDISPPTPEMDKVSPECEVRKGPWTVEEDIILINYIANHGEGIWNTVARSSGLKRTGKSCRLRWLNYLRPDLRRGNITTEEQLLIIELHSKWGNRWSKIAKHLPGRTDNEIKNFWRTKIQKHMTPTEHTMNRAMQVEAEGIGVHDQDRHDTSRTTTNADRQLLSSPFGYDGAVIQAYSGGGGVDVASSSTDVEAMECFRGSFFSQPNDAVWWEDAWSMQ